MKTVSSITGDKNAVITGQANSMIADMKKSDNQSYKVVDYSTAVENAKNGGLSIVAYNNPVGHGHLATFAVGDNIKSKYKETVANIGPKEYSGFISLNMAISSKKEKIYFIYQQKEPTK